MRYLIQTFWLTMRCICSERVAGEVLFADDHQPRPMRRRRRRTTSTQAPFAHS